MPYAKKEDKLKNNQEYYLVHKEQILERTKQYQKRVKRLYDNIKHNLGCQKCGETNSDKLMFHHTNPANKKCRPSKCGSINALLEEANKCVVLCKSCHNKIHKTKGGEKRSTGSKNHSYHQDTGAMPVASIF